MWKGKSGVGRGKEGADFNPSGTGRWTARTCMQNIKDEYPSTLSLMVRLFNHQISELVEHILYLVCNLLNCRLSTLPRICTWYIPYHDSILNWRYEVMLDGDSRLQFMPREIRQSSMLTMAFLGRRVWESREVVGTRQLLESPSEAVVCAEWYVEEDNLDENGKGEWCFYSGTTLPFGFLSCRLWHP